jgi:membrane protein DedA with SNARE-associated domain
MEDFIANELSLYGPLAVFILLMLSGVGIPVGEDLVNIPAGAFIAGGALELWPVLVMAYLGVVCSDCLWFTICSRYGTPLLHRRWFKRFVHPRRLLQAKHELEERGVWLVVMARFIPSSRTTAISISGMLHMPFWKFFTATALCVLVTVPMQVGVGYLIGLGVAADRGLGHSSPPRRSPATGPRRVAAGVPAAGDASEARERNSGRRPPFREPGGLTPRPSAARSLPDHLTPIRISIVR